MSDALIFEFKGVTADQYNQVNEVLGLNPKTGEGDWPAGLLTHTGAVGAGGDITVFEVWDSQESQADWMSSRLGPALAKVEVAEPVRVEWLSVLGAHPY
jgi:hypothetical protein